MGLSPAVRALLSLEIRSLLRDPRTLFITVVLPVILIPGLLLATSLLEDRRAQEAEERTFRVAVSGDEAALARDLLASHRRSDSDAGAPGNEAATEGNDGEGRFRIHEVDEPERALEADSIDLHVETLSVDAWRSLEAEAADELSEEFHGVPVLRLHYHSTRTASREGWEAARDALGHRRELARDSLLDEAGFPVDRDEVAVVEALDLATERQIQGAHLGRYLALILLGLVVLGGSAVATDTLAGEKERGTLHTLLTSAAHRSEIITGKFLAVMAVALAIAGIQLLNLWVFLGLGIIEPMEGFAVAVSPGLALGLFVLLLPAVALAAGVLLLISAHARSYKEAQLYLTPAFIGVVLPTAAPLLPGLTLDSAAVAVPIANVSLAARDLLVGQAQLPWILAAWLITGVAAVWVNARSVRTLQDESLVTGDTSREEFLGGPALLPKRILRWFVVFGAVKLLVEFNLPFQDLRWAILVNVGVVFLVFPLLVIRYFRLDPGKALALRMPHPGVWAGVALAVPSGLLAGQGVFQAMDLVLPVPAELIEGFGEILLTDGIPLWQLILLVSLVPGITEELTFRGVLLHGLRKRFGPVGLALVVGLLFGLMHFQLFRIPTTAFLGVLLTAVTLLSGSIFPAIVWHTLNNALAVYLGSAGMDVGALEVWWIGAGMLGLAAAFALFWRFRTPYPDLRTPEGGRDRPSPVPKENFTGTGSRPGPGAGSGPDR